MDRETLIYDIETIPGPRLSEYLERKTFKPSGNCKSDEAKAKSIAEKRDEFAAKAALYWWVNQIVAISFRTLDSPLVSLAGSDERRLLGEFFDILLLADYRMIGKNGHTFDAPTLRGRAMALDLGIPPPLRPYRVEDVEDIFGPTGSAARGSLDDYAFGLQIEGKSGHGPQVFDWYKEGNWGAIKTYNAQDVEITAEIWRRYDKSYYAKDAR